MKIRWQFGILAAVFLAVFTLYPQAKMLYLRGDDWNGHYAYNDIDEVAYASYVRALIDGRPRKNDPYSGRDHSAATPQEESLFSIQFAAPYTVALPARLLGIGAPWAMTLSGAFAGFTAALAAFWLLWMLTRNNWFAMAAGLGVFCFGTLASGEGAVSEVFFKGFSYPYFPGFRRYIPAMAMPAFFVLVALVWKLLGHGEVLGRDNADESETEPDRRAAAPPRHGGKLLLTVLAALAFAYTVFSYFYIWTTAAAWLGCLGLLWVVLRPENFKKDLRTFAVLGGLCAAALLPYAYLLSKRSHTMDDVQLLVYTRAPDLARVPEYISLLCLILLGAGIASKTLRLRERSTIFAASLALVPLIVFNQQIVTGRSLQPIHYQVFIGNYVAALALAVTVGLLWLKNLRQNDLMTRVTCTAVLVLAVIWGFVECHYTVRVLDEANVERDIALPVAKRLEELAAADPDPHRSTVLAYDMLQADDLPTVAPQNVLWARHQHVFPGLTWQENKERYYQFLYYSNIDEKGLDYLLRRDFVSMIALFGWGRHTNRLSSEARPLTLGEIAEEVARYAEYRTAFDARTAADPRLDFVVLNTEAGTDITNLDRWYERYDGEAVGKYMIFRLRPRE